MSLDEHDIDEWDETFLNEALRLEFEALSSRKPPSSPPPPLAFPSRSLPPPVPSARAPPPSGPQVKKSLYGDVDVAALTAGVQFSPPRELSQRPGGERQRGNVVAAPVPDFNMVESWGVIGKSDGSRKNSVSNNDNNREFEKLKRELTRVSKQLSNLENECTELKKDRTKKETQLKNAFNQIEARETEIRNLKRASTSNGEMKGGTMNLHFNGEDLKAGSSASVEGSNKEISSSKKKKANLKDSAVQTDFPQESNSDDKNNNNNSNQNNQNTYAKSLHWKLILNNLRATWGLVPISKRSRIDIISREIFSFVSSAEVAESGTKDAVFMIHSIIEKSHNETEQLRYIVEELLNLCRFQNVSIVAKSVRLLHRILHQLISSENTSIQRKNVLFEQGGERNGREVSISKQNSDFEILPLELWSSIFDIMQIIAMKNHKEDFASDALSIMILVVMMSNVNTNREKFGLVPVLECVHEILKKQKDPNVKEKVEAGLSVKKQAVYLLFLILNCPKMLALFCTGGRENNDLISNKSEGQSEKVLQQFISSVLEDLGYCLWEEKQEIWDKNKGEGQDKFTSMLELKLVRQVIILLAYIASYGESGFELLLGPVGPTGLNLLERIVKVISNQMDLEIGEIDKTHALSNKERYMVFRESLILLNRLASHTIYSKTTLEILTSSQSCASLTIEIANRMPRIGQSQSRPHMNNNKNIEFDIADLALGFRSRVFAFLGEMK
ncbi:hypothetical protein LUZ60_009486 [Juncus effusus]|nr:hypothetical protein LUZ60_009486 [Juncus effusus]